MLATEAFIDKTADANPAMGGANTRTENRWRGRSRLF
jgi:hypothetical protein